MQQSLSRGDAIAFPDAPIAHEARLVRDDADGARVWHQRAREGSLPPVLREGEVGEDRGGNDQGDGRQHGEGNGADEDDSSKASPLLVLVHSLAECRPRAHSARASSPGLKRRQNRMASGMNAAASTISTAHVPGAVAAGSDLRWSSDGTPGRIIETL